MKRGITKQPLLNGENTFSLQLRDNVCYRDVNYTKLTGGFNRA